ncbi:MAG: tRNA (cytidine(34)-2'-O)-methyltransferase [Hyphomicrobiaceae bacterium]|nr:tRNA (cytidine(34)-2'-O)-methyltransferase [Hyphomicrobiaceae bacterium]
MRLALYQPDIPQNTGTILRMAACFGIPVDVIGPAGFDLSNRALRRAGLDYLTASELTLHSDWTAFLAQRTPTSASSSAHTGDKSSRLVLLTTRASTAHIDFAFRPDDCLLLGRESAGAPDHVHAAANASIRIPIRPGLRSLNIAVAAAVVLGEALRQTGRYPEIAGSPDGASLK